MRSTVVGPSLLQQRRSLESVAKRSKVVQTQCLFGRSKNDEAARRRDEQWEIQQDILRRRRSGVGNDKVNARREKVSKYMRNTMDPAEKAAIDKKNRAKAAALSKETIKGGIPFPMASFGMPEFDGGERFDLKGPYVDEGWVDENESEGGPFKALKNLFKKR
ncbi:hypothetical protein CYMTET_29152 [Cymbomonas tetramitiformis]|uniref:Uncharacterized protein n=1 Tax=Cymbomonas tetramitiformis TaxID=36881 RepID=A0AAE0FLL9_9CHLO|nr:hypothetical protein CYMTET_29152 [Cymbomonas tetramitiformis]|eukprot:gene9574-11340_t